jgi:linoleoyl-CoA desaturase
MKVAAVKFDNKRQTTFVKELRKNVNQYFKDNNITQYANMSMKFKTAFMIALYFVPMILMYTGVVSGLWPIMAMWFLMGLGMSGIGLSIMHDANHGAYSKNKKVNQALGYLLNFLGAYHINWQIQHNMLHHSFTNIDGFDGDIENPIMRFSPTQKRKKFFRFQVFYAPILYGLMTLYWIISKDFERLVRYNKRGYLNRKGLTLKNAMIRVVFNKIWYLGLTLALPMLIVNLPWWQTLLGFLMMHYICGLLLALIFQPAHVVEHTEFFAPPAEGELIENNWAIHQLRTTSNFAHKSRIFSWFIGGLNYQVEHHLFPHICHIHYKKISEIVKATAQKYGHPYHQQGTFFDALKSHFTLLHLLGTGKYDKLKKVPVQVS